MDRILSTTLINEFRSEKLIEMWNIYIITFVLLFLNLVCVTMVKTLHMYSVRRMQMSAFISTIYLLLFSRQFKWGRWWRIIWRGCGEKLVRSRGVWQQCWKWPGHVPNPEEPVNKVTIPEQAIQDRDEPATKETSQGTRTWRLGMFIPVKCFLLTPLWWDM